MTSTTQSRVRERFQRALARLIETIEQDQHILAAVLFGSLSYDTVWEKSDIDLMLISREEPSKEVRGLLQRAISLTELDVNIHASVHTRSAFRKMMEGAVRSSFIHSSLVKSRLLFSRDPSIDALYRDLEKLGDRDRQVQLIRAGCEVVPCLAKAEKFLEIKGDPRYAFLWLSYAYSPLARIEVLLDRQIAQREVIHQALELNPELFGAIYTELIDRKKTKARVRSALDRVDRYLTERIPLLFGPLFDYLEAQGTLRSTTQIDSWFRQQMDVGGIVLACEWLADKGVLTPVSTPLRLTRRSRVEVPELGYFYQS